MYDLTNTIYTKVKQAVLALYPTAKVVKPYQAQTTTFPYVTVEDVNDFEVERSLDYGQRQSQYSCQIEVYMNGGTAETIAKKIANAIVEVMENQLHMTRNFSGTVDNVADTTIYRYVMRYKCKIDEDSKKIY